MTDTFDNWGQVPRTVFAPLGPNAGDDHLAVLAAFHAAVFEPAINLETLSNRLRSTAPDLADDDTVLLRSLRALVDWELLEESRDDTITYRDPAEFARRHTQWTLTHIGQATIAALDAAYDQLRAVAALQPAAIDAIASALSEVADWLDGTAGPVDAEIAAQVHVRLFDAEQHHRSLVENLRTFTRDVNRTLGRTDIGDDDLDEAKAHIISYLDRYVIGTDGPARRVSAALDRLDRLGFDYVAGVATDGANLAPGLDGIDPAVRARAARREHLAGLRAWFETDNPQAMFSQLLPRGRDAVLSFLRVLGIRREVARRNASLPEDFRTLARVFSATTSDTDAHRLWAAATGLTRARHHYLLADDADMPASRGNPAHANPPAELTVELRRRPRSTGRPSHGRPVPDRRDARAAAQARAALELAETNRLREAVATDGTVRTSTFAELSRAQYDVFLDLIADTLSSACDSDGRRRMLSADGRVQVTVEAVDEHARSHQAKIRTDDGVLRLPDLEVRVEVVGRAAQPSGAASA